MNEPQQVILPGEKEQLELIAQRQLSKFYSSLAGSKEIPKQYLADTLSVLSAPGRNIYEEILREMIKKAEPRFKESSGLKPDPVAMAMKDKLFLPEEQKLFGSYIDRDKKRFVAQFDGVENDQKVDDQFLSKWVQHRAEVFRRQHLAALQKIANTIFKDDESNADILVFKPKPTWLTTILQAAEDTSNATPTEIPKPTDAPTAQQNPNVGTTAETASAASQTK